MSFLKISDPVKRDLIVKEYLELKKNIRDNLLSEKTEELELQTDLSKFYRPITETQQETARDITEGLKPIREGIEKLPQAITFPAYPSIQAFEKQLEGEEDAPYVGEIAKTYLKKFTTKDEADRTYGLYDKAGKFYIGNKLAIIVDNDLVLGRDEYEGTPGLWELIVSKEPKDFSKEDYGNYANLMVKTSAIHRGNDPENKHPKSSKGYKWKTILRDIWYKEKDRKERKSQKEKKKYKERSPYPGDTYYYPYKEYEGKGVVVIPSDPNALLERLDLLLASQKAGHTGVGNDII